MPKEVKFVLVAVAVVVGLWGFMALSSRDRPQGDMSPAPPASDGPSQRQAEPLATAQRPAAEGALASGAVTASSTAAVGGEPSQVKALQRQLEREKRKVERLKETADVGADVLAKTGVYGNVCHPDKSVAPRARVALSPEDHGARESTETDGEGRYEIAGLRAGPYTATCDLYPEREVPVTVVYGKMTRQDFGGDRKVTVYGYVTLDDGTPVQGRIMMADATFSSRFMEQLDAEGYYEFEGVPRNEYRINIYRATGGGGSAGSIQLPEHVSEYRHDVVLSALTISGTVTAGDGGEVVRGGNVQASCQKDGQSHFAGARISDTGEFQLDNLVPGQYSLSFMVDGYAIERTAVDVGEEGGVPDLGVELTPVAPVWFIVADQHGDPVSSNVRYIVSAGSSSLCATPRPLKDGSLVLRQLAPGEYRLQMTAEGYGDFQGNVTVPEEGFPVDDPFDIKMQKLE